LIHVADLPSQPHDNDHRCGAISQTEATRYRNLISSLEFPNEQLTRVLWTEDAVFRFVISTCEVEATIHDDQSLLVRLLNFVMRPLMT